MAPALLLMYFDSRCGSTIVRLQSLARDATTATLILEVKESDFALGKPRHGPSVPCVRYMYTLVRRGAEEPPTVSRQLCTRRAFWWIRVVDAAVHV